MLVMSRLSLNEELGSIVYECQYKDYKIYTYYVYIYIYFFFF